MIMVKFWQAKNLKKSPELVQAFSTRAYGNLSWQTAKTQGKWLETGAAQNQFARDLGVNPLRLVSTFQLHSKKVAVVGPKLYQIPVWPADALITNQPGTTLMIHTADCLPVLMYDSDKRATAAVHAGWRGILAEILPEAVMALAHTYDSRPTDLVVAIGPHLGPCHFEVQNDVWGQFEKQFKTPRVFKDLGGQRFIDLGVAAREQLISAGVKSQNIELSTVCTYCDPDFSSWRRDKRSDLAMGNVIGIKI